MAKLFQLFCTIVKLTKLDFYRLKCKCILNENITMNKEPTISISVLANRNVIAVETLYFGTEEKETVRRVGIYSN